MIIDRPYEKDYPGLQALWKEAFSDTDSFIHTFWEFGFSPNRCRCISVNGSVVSALYWFDAEIGGEKAAYLYAVATKNICRNQGLCRKLLEDTHLHLQSLGYAFAVLVPGTASLFDYYEKLGYRCFGGVRKALISASSTPVPLQEISPESYFSLSKGKYPENSVILGLHALQFLGRWGQFYQGENCLLAAAKDGQTLYVQAFWGDLGTAPAVLKALGCKDGHFITLGGTEPYAMYYPLTPNTAPPAAFITDLA